MNLLIIGIVFPHQYIVWSVKINRELFCIMYNMQRQKRIRQLLILCIMFQSSFTVSYLFLVMVKHDDIQMIQKNETQNYTLIFVYELQHSRA